MASRAGSYWLVLLLVSVMVRVSVVGGGCYSTWSRCSKWSSAGTGILWKNCNDRCIELGHRGGSCKYCPSTCWMSEKAWTCRCDGTPPCQD